MTNEEIKKEYRKIFKKMTPDDSVAEFQDLFIIQRKKYKGKRKDYNKDGCVLIDLKTCVLAGSGICPHCNGWIGRTEFGDD